MTDDQLIESLRARMWPGDCEAAAFRLEELRALAAELKALREQEPVGIVDEDDDGVFADLETANGVLVKLGDKLYAHPAPARDLTDEAIENLHMQVYKGPSIAPARMLSFARAIERHLKGEGE